MVTAAMSLIPLAVPRNESTVSEKQAPFFVAALCQKPGAVR